VSEALASGFCLYSRSSIPRQPIRGYSAGFTLLELLIAAFIVALISTGFIRLNIGFGNPAQSLENEVNRLHRLLGLTAQKAILQGSEIGILVEQDAYRFLFPGKQYWEAFSADNFLKRRQLPQGWELVLMQDDQVITPALVPLGDDGVEDKKKMPPPTALFYASGEVTPFRLSIYSSNNSEPYTIDVQANGEIEIIVPEVQE
jgi:general secretion pathway protein H